jgi:antitoxin ParD1/3/4
MPISADLGETLEKVVTDLVANGRYNSKSEVLREGVRLVQEREAALAKLTAILDESMDDFDAGRSDLLEDVVERLTAEYDDVAKRKSA